MSGEPVSSDPESVGAGRLKRLSTVDELRDRDADRLRELAADLGTPTHVLDLERVRERYRRLSSALGGARVHHAARADARPRLLRALRRNGAGVECVSLQELRSALDAGFAPARIHYAAVAPDESELAAIVEYCRGAPATTVTVGDRSTLKRLEELGFRGRVVLQAVPGGSDQFGFGPEGVREVVAALPGAVRLAGFRCHPPTADDGGVEFADAVGALLGECRPVDFLGIEGFDGTQDPSLARRLVAAARGVDVVPAVAPGGSLLADAGTLLVRAGDELLATTGPDAGASRPRDGRGRPARAIVDGDDVTLNSR